MTSGGNNLNDLPDNNWPNFVQFAVAQAGRWWLQCLSYHRISYSALPSQTSAQPQAGPGW